MGNGILLLFMAHHYYNSGGMDVYRALGRIGHPHVTVMDVNSNPLDQILRAIRDASILVVDHMLLNALDLTHDERERSYALRWRGQSHYTDLLDAVFAADCRRALMITYWDAHTPLIKETTRRRWGALSRFDALLWGYEPLVGEALHTHGPQDAWMDTAERPEINIREVCNLISRRVDVPWTTPLGHARRPGTHRGFNVVVPGSQYGSRLVALKSARSAHLRAYPYRGLNSVTCRLLAATRINGVVPVLEKCRQVNYQLGMWSSQIAWVDGSSYRYPVRKFWEAPFFGCSVVTSGFPNMERYGFKAGVTHVETSPDDFGEVASNLLNESAMLRALADEGQQLVMRWHTPLRRATQVTQALEALGRDELQWAGFVDGRFEVSGRR